MLHRLCWYLLRYVSNGIQFSKSSVGDKSSQILSAEWPSGNLLWSPHFFSISTQSDLQIKKEAELHEQYLKKKRSCSKKISFHNLPFPKSTTFPSVSQQSVFIYVCICYILHTGGGINLWHKDRNYCLHYSSSTLGLVILIFYGIICVYLSRSSISLIYSWLIWVELYLTTCTINWSLFYPITYFQKKFLFLKQLHFFKTFLSAENHQ